MKKHLLVIPLFVLTLSANAQYKVVPVALDSSILKFFTGKWAGEGKFANGRPISSDLLINLTLDDAWLEINHNDRLPNNYKAKSYWGINAETGELVVYIFDNFHGHRQFSTNGWEGNILVLSSNHYFPRRGMVYERFIYEKQTLNSFKMIYETSRDAITWKIGDWLLFTKQ